MTNAVEAWNEQENDKREHSDGDRTWPFTEAVRSYCTQYRTPKKQEEEEMSVTRKPPLSPLNANRSEMDAYARKAGGLQSTGPNMGAATRNRMTPPTTSVPTVPSTPGTAPVEGSEQMAGQVRTPSGPAVVTANVLDVGQCKVGDQISFSVLNIQNGQVQLGSPLVLPGTPQGAVQ